MTGTRTTSVTVDQFVPAPPQKVWRGLTDPELHARRWAPGDIAPVVGHRFHLQMPRYGAIACEVLEVVPPDPETFDRMGPGWRDVVVPRLADLAAALD